MKGASVVITSTNKVSGTDQAAVDAVKFVTLYGGGYDRLCRSMVISLRKCLVWNVLDLADTCSEATHCRVRHLTWLLTCSGYRYKVASTVPWYCCSSLSVTVAVPMSLCRRHRTSYGSLLLVCPISDAVFMSYCLDGAAQDVKELF